MKTKNTLLVLAVSGILAACGSSSSQGIIKPPADDTTTQPSKPTTFGQAVFSKSGSKTEAMLIADSQDHKVTTNLKENSIVVDGTEISLTDDNQFLMDKGGNKNAMMAMYYDISVHKAMFFAGGQLTQEMPTTKEDIIYKGEAIDAAKSKTAKASVRLPAEFTVNFHDKLLKGTIGADEHGNIKVSADITGNTFNGEHPFDVNPAPGIGAKGSTYVEGGFYGEGASDIAGAYARQGTYRNNGIEVDLTTHGVFHAEKQ